MDKTIETKYVKLVKSRIGIKERPITEIDMILYLIPGESHFYKQLYKIIPKIEHRIGLSEKEN